MVTYYSLQGKSFDYDTFEGTETNEQKEIFKTFKRKIIEIVDISPELERIAKDGLPSPKYRASVYKYLDMFFNNPRNFPKDDIIDYSDFEGKIRPFPPREPEEDMDTEYERFLGFHETYRNDWRNITEYDCRLGFIFAVNKRGFHLQMLAENRETVAFYFRGKECFRAFAFDPMRDRYDPDPRGSWHMRIHTSTDERLTMLTGSYHVVMLLSYLLKETEKKPLYFTDPDKRNLGMQDTADRCFSWMIHDSLHKKINEERFVLPKVTKFENRTWDTYVERLKYFGYDVKTVTTHIKYLDDNGKDHTTQRMEYYIPPFICKKDSDLIIRCINDSELPKGEKQRLVRKFISESGCCRYSKDDFEESEIPTPAKEGKVWSDNDYALIIYTVMRLVARPLPITSTTKDVAKRKENLVGLIAQHYGSPTNRPSITNNVKSMVALGLLVEKEGKKYAFDMSTALTADDLEQLQNCIAKNNALDENIKVRVIDKIKNKFKNLFI